MKLMFIFSSLFFLLSLNSFAQPIALGNEEPPNEKNTIQEYDIPSAAGGTKYPPQKLSPEERERLAKTIVAMQIGRAACKT